MVTTATMLPDGMPGPMTPPFCPTWKTGVGGHDLPWGSGGGGMYSGLRGSARAPDTPSAAIGVYVPPAPAWSVLRTTAAEPLLVGAGALLSPPEPVALTVEVAAPNITAAPQMDTR